MLVWWSSFTLRLGKKVEFILVGMGILGYPFKLLILGANVLCSGRKKPSYKYKGVNVCTSDKGAVTGSIHFRSGDIIEEILLT